MKWTKVEDEKPEIINGHDVQFLLAWDDGVIESGWYLSNGYFQHANGDMNYHEEPDVTHWMPLPEPPSKATI